MLAGICHGGVFAGMYRSVDAHDAGLDLRLRRVSGNVSDDSCSCDAGWAVEACLKKCKLWLMLVVLDG